MGPPRPSMPSPPYSDPATVLAFPLRLPRTQPRLPCRLFLCFLGTPYACPACILVPVLPHQEVLTAALSFPPCPLMAATQDLPQTPPLLCGKLSQACPWRSYCPSPWPQSHPACLELCDRAPLLDQKVPEARARVSPLRVPLPPALATAPDTVSVPQNERITLNLVQRPFPLCCVEVKFCSTAH